jgi:hypothetical protein
VVSLGFAGVKAGELALQTAGTQLEAGYMKAVEATDVSDALNGTLDAQTLPYTTARINGFWHVAPYGTTLRMMDATFRLQRLLQWTYQPMFDAFTMRVWLVGNLTAQLRMPDQPASQPPLAMTSQVTGDMILTTPFYPGPGFTGLSYDWKGTISFHPDPWVVWKLAEAMYNEDGSTNSTLSATGKTNVTELAVAAPSNTQDAARGDSQIWWV